MSLRRALRRHGRVRQGRTPDDEPGGAPKAAVEGSAQLGFTPDQVFVIGVIAAVCLVVYLIPRTAPLGAVLWTGYFGGAIVTHFRVGNPLFSHVLFPIYVSTLIWASVYLRDPRVRAVLGKR